MPTPFEKLSAHLNTQDPDSLAWADGLGHEVASELLSQFSEDDWGELSVSWKLQSKSWRACLAVTLYPKNETASRILLDMTADPDTEVAFDALRVVSFYCGVNANADGPFLDECICSPDFLSLAEVHPSLLSQLKRVSARCTESYRRQFELLASRIT